METQSPGQRDSAVDDLVHHAVLARGVARGRALRASAAGERASRRSALTEAKAYLKRQSPRLGPTACQRRHHDTRASMPVSACAVFSPR